MYSMHPTTYLMLRSVPAKPDASRSTQDADAAASAAGGSVATCRLIPVSFSRGKHSLSALQGGEGGAHRAAMGGRGGYPASALESPTSPRPSPPPNGPRRAERE